MKGADVDSIRTSKDNLGQFCGVRHGVVLLCMWVECCEQVGSRPDAWNVAAVVCRRNVPIRRKFCDSQFQVGDRLVLECGSDVIAFDDRVVPCFRLA